MLKKDITVRHSEYFGQILKSLLYKEGASIKINENGITDITASDFGRYVVAWDTFLTMDSQTLYAFLSTRTARHQLLTTVIERINKTWLQEVSKGVRYCTLGLWLNNGMIHFELISFTNSLDNANDWALEAKQYSFYDLLEGKEIVIDKEGLK